jgi:long-chain acyl-CoA synthetase
MKEINEKLMAGISAYEKDEIEKIITEIENSISKANEKNISELTEVLDKVINNGYSKIFAEKVSPDVFFEFGKFLASSDSSENKLIHNYLDIFRNPEFLEKIYDDRRWDKLIEDLIRKSNFRVRELFYQRANLYKQKILFRTLEGKKRYEFTWDETKNKVEQFSLALRTLLSKYNSDVKVAFLLENSLEMAWLDLACLTSGIVNIMIPANSVPEHIQFIMNQAEAKVIFVANEKQLAKIKQIRNDLKTLDKIVLLSGTSINKEVLSFEQFLSLAKE